MNNYSTLSLEISEEVYNALMEIIGRQYGLRGVNISQFAEEVLAKYIEERAKKPVRFSVHVFKQNSDYFWRVDAVNPDEIYHPFVKTHSFSLSSLDLKRLAIDKFGIYAEEIEFI